MRAFLLVEMQNVSNEFLLFLRNILQRIKSQETHKIEDHKIAQVNKEVGHRRSGITLKLEFRILCSVLLFRARNSSMQF